MIEKTIKKYKEKEKRNEAKKLQTEMNLPKIPKISQSLIKALYKYKIGDECGLRIRFISEYLNGLEALKRNG